MPRVLCNANRSLHAQAPAQPLYFFKLWSSCVWDGMIFTRTSTFCNTLGGLQKLLKHTAPPSYGVLRLHAVHVLSLSTCTIAGQVCAACAYC